MIFALLLMQASAPDIGRVEWREPPDCWEGVQGELTHCAWAEYRAADAQLNQQWQQTAEVMKRLDSESPPNAEVGQSSYFEALLAGQRAWLDFRDKNCLLFRAGGGSIAPMLEGICLRDITKRRAEELASMALNPSTGQPYFSD